MMPTAVKNIVFISTIFGMSLFGAPVGDSSRVSGLIKDGDGRMKLERTLESLVEKVPKAVKILEFHDETRSFFLLKLSNNSYGVLNSTETAGDAYTWKVINGEKGLQIPEKRGERLTGNFTYSFNDSGSGQLVPTTYTWGIDEIHLNLEHSTHFVFNFEFSGGNGRTGKLVSIAVDWEAGRAEGIKVLPLRKP